MSVVKPTPDEARALQERCGYCDAGRGEWCRIFGYGAAVDAPADVLHPGRLQLAEFIDYVLGKKEETP